MSYVSLFLNLDNFGRNDHQNASKEYPCPKFLIISEILAWIRNITILYL